jgi:hypothetical protein
MKDSTFISLSKLAAPNNKDIPRDEINNLLMGLYKYKFDNDDECEEAINSFLEFCSTRTEFFVPAAQEDNFRFFHRSFFEYFYTRYILRESDVKTIYRLMTQFDVDSEVFELVAAILKEENEENNIFNRLRYSYSFEARLILSSIDSKVYYSQINKFIREYGVKIVRSFKHERVYIGRKTIGLIHYRGNTLCLAFAPEVEKFLENKHKVFNMSGVSRYDDTPLMMKINSNRKVKYAIHLLTKLFEDQKIENKQLNFKEEKIPTKSKRTLIKAGLIKTYK